MQLSGIQKLTLLDFPGKVACTVFTGGCNFKCPFCHNASLVLPEQVTQDIDEEEILNFLKKRIGILDGVAVTGGEPLIHNEIDGFLGKIKDLGFKIKLDTNGSSPNHLKSIVENGLVDRVAMDIKNSPDLYGKTIGIDGFDISNCEISKNYLLEGRIDYEFRTTVVKGLHTKDSLIGAAKWIAGANEYYLQQFKDSGNVIAIDGLGPFNENEMNELKSAVEPIVPTVKLRGV